MPDNAPPTGPNSGDTAPVGAGTPPTGAGSGAPSTPPTGDTAWYSVLPADLQSDPNITKYKSLDELARGHVSAVSLLGREKIPMPKTDEEFLDVYRRLGAPRTEDEYVFPETDYQIPETLYPKTTQENDRKTFQKWAFESGLTNKQATQLYDKFMTYQKTTLASVSQVVENQWTECGQQMQEAWGEARETNLAIASRAMNHIFGKEVTEAITAAGLGRNFGFIQGMYQLGLKSLDDLGIDKRGSSIRTPDELRSELANIQAHPAYFDKGHPQHRQVNEQAMALIARLRK